MNFNRKCFAFTWSAMEAFLKFRIFPLCWMSNVRSELRTNKETRNKQIKSLVHCLHLLLCGMFMIWCNQSFFIWCYSIHCTQRVNFIAFQSNQIMKSFRWKQNFKRNHTSCESVVQFDYLDTCCVWPFCAK